MASNLKNDPYYVRRTGGIGIAENASENQGYEQLACEMEQQVQAKPISAAAIAVGVGLGAGLLLSTVLSSERTQKERFARRLGSFLSQSGNLRSSVENMLPNAITDRYFN